MSKYSQAKDLSERTSLMYEGHKEKLENTQKNLTDVIDNYNKLKWKIWSGFDGFIVAFERIKNLPPKITGSVSNEEVDFSALDINGLKLQINTSNNILSGVASSIAAGVGTAGAVALAEVAATLGTVGLTTGTLGFSAGISLASSSIAMAGFSPIGVFIAPVLLASGVVLHFKGKRALEEAEQQYDKAKEACDKMDKIKAQLERIIKCCEDSKKEINRLNSFYLLKFNQLNETLARTTCYDEFTREEQYALEATILSLKILKDYISTQLILEKNDNNGISCDFQKLNDEMHLAERRRQELLSNDRSFFYSTYGYPQTLTMTQCEDMIRRKENLCKSYDKEMTDSYFSLLHNQMVSLREKEIEQLCKVDKEWTYSLARQVKSQIQTDSLVSDSFKEKMIQRIDSYPKKLGINLLSVFDFLKKEVKSASSKTKKTSASTVNNAQKSDQNFVPIRNRLMQKRTVGDFIPAVLVFLGSILWVTAFKNMGFTEFSSDLFYSVVPTLLFISAQFIFRLFPTAFKSFKIHRHLFAVLYFLCVFGDEDFEYSSVELFAMLVFVYAIIVVPATLIIRKIRQREKTTDESTIK